MVGCLWVCDCVVACVGGSIFDFVVFAGLVCGCWFCV